MKPIAYMSLTGPKSLNDSRNGSLMEPFIAEPVLVRSESLSLARPKSERGKPFWKSGAFWVVVALVVVFCWMVNSCGAADDSATQSMPNVVGLSCEQARRAFEDYQNVDYVDAKGSPVASGAVTGQKPKAGARISHSTEITVTVDPLGKTKEQKTREAAEERDRQLRRQAS